MQIFAQKICAFQKIPYNLLFILLDNNIYSKGYFEPTVAANWTIIYTQKDTMSQQQQLTGQ